MDFNFKEISKQIRALLQVVAADATPGAPPVAPAPAVTLKDGTPVTIDKMEVGGSILINGLPADDGQYEMADGTMITTVNGLITEMESPAESDAEPAEMEKFKTDFAAMQTEFGAFKIEFSTMKTELGSAKETIGKQDQAIQLLLQAVEKLAQMPVSEPVEKANNFKADKSEAKEARMKGILEAVKTIKKEN